MRYIMFIAVLLVGCATTNWAHPNKTPEQFSRDKYDCQQDASQRAANAGSPNNPLLTPGYFRDCMVNKYGYTPVKGRPQ